MASIKALASELLDPRTTFVKVTDKTATVNVASSKAKPKRKGVKR